MFSYLEHLDLYFLKLAGSRYVTENIRSLPRLSFSKYVERIRGEDEPRPTLLIAAAKGHESLLRALLENGIHSDLPLTQSARRKRERAELCKHKWDGMLAIHQAAASGQ